MRPTTSPLFPLLATLVALVLGGSAALCAAPALTVQTTSREEVRQFYRTIYPLSENVPLGWTGTYTTGTSPVTAAGTTSSAFKEAVLLRINFFRALAGVPAVITLNSTYSVKNQQAALMMSANNTLKHDSDASPIPPAWNFYTADGAAASRASNLTIGLNGPAAISSLMQDSDGSFGDVSVGANARVGHRRWLLYPQTKEMGTGDVPGNGTNTVRAAHASWIVDVNYGQTRPATRDTFVAYPPPGYVPHQLVWPRWSFSHPSSSIDFSAATVTMTRNGSAIPVRLEVPAAGSGENTLVWTYDNLTTAESTGHARPTADTVYNVTITNAKLGVAVLAPVSYQVTVFDPAVASPGFAESTVITGTSTPTTATASAYTVAKAAFATGIEWRTVALRPFAKTYHAEAGLDGLVASVTPASPATVQTTVVGRGAASYRLSHQNPPSTQVLLLPDTLLVGPGSSFNFLSFLNVSANTQTAHVQISTDDGATWTDLFTQAGTSVGSTPAPTDTGFIPRSLSLAAYTGRTVRLRLTFTIDPGTAYPGADNNPVGWFVDDITVTGAQIITPSAATAVASAAGTTSANFTFTPAANGPLGLQARGVLFGAYPQEWGTVNQVTAVPPGAAANPGRLINLSVLTDLTTAGDNFTLGYVVGGGGTAGAKPLVIRAVGPSLGALGVPGTLDDPKLELFAGAAKTLENDNWGGSASLTNSLVSVGAFAFTGPTSKDAAVASDITTRDNSVSVSAANNGTGRVIAEIYDATAAGRFTTSTPRLLNVSVRKHLGTGLTAGFVVGGSTPARILIRAVGPGLAAFGVPDTVIDPQLSLFNDKSQEIAANDNWAGTTELTAAFNAVGAFALPAATSKDAALVLTLQPGLYSVQVSGVNSTTGVALVEVYEVP